MTLLISSHMDKVGQGQGGKEEGSRLRAGMGTEGACFPRNTPNTHSTECRSIRKQPQNGSAQVGAVMPESQRNMAAKFGRDLKGKMATWKQDLEL